MRGFEPFLLSGQLEMFVDLSIERYRTRTVEREELGLGERVRLVAVGRLGISDADRLVCCLPRFDTAFRRVLTRREAEGQLWETGRAREEEHSQIARQHLEHICVEALLPYCRVA
jgi:hypothetical protein